MKLFLVSLLVATVVADKLQKGYLPPVSAHSAGGDGHVLETPHKPNYAIYASSVNHGIGNVDYAKQSNSESHAQTHPVTNPPIKVISYESNNDGSGNYAYAYETENKISVEESNQIKNQGSRNAANYVRGSYSYSGPDGVVYTVTYFADENGYHASGAHLPTPPPIPEAIQQALEYNAAHPEEDFAEASPSSGHQESHQAATHVVQGSTRQNVPVVPHHQSVHPAVPAPAVFVPHPVHPAVPVPSSVAPQPSHPAVSHYQPAHPAIAVPSGFVPQPNQPNFSHSKSTGQSSYAYSQSDSNPQVHPSGFVSHSESSNHHNQGSQPSSSHVHPSHGAQPNKPSYHEQTGYHY